MPLPFALDVYHERRRAKEAKTRDELVARLQEHAGVTGDALLAFKHSANTHDRKGKINSPNGNPMILRGNQRRVDGIEKSFRTVTPSVLLKAIIEHIESHVPNGRRIQVYEKIVTGISTSDPIGKNPITKNPHEVPRTPFSISRDTPEKVKSNAQLIDSLAAAVDLDPPLTFSIRGQITWWDSINRRGMSGLLHGSTGIVTGGRLGRDHTLEDVPNVFVRDKLLDFINTQLEEDQKSAARKAVFSDLTSSDLDEYSVLIAKQREEDENAEDDPLDGGNTITQIVGRQKRPHSCGEEENVTRQADALESLDSDIDLTPRPGFARRDYVRTPAIQKRSVVVPGSRKITPREIHVVPGTDIDRDCDQIRAMIYLFTAESEWCLDQFRRALVGREISRPMMTAFLEKKGASEGVDHPVYQLSWEFFKKRDMMKLPYPGSRCNAEEEHKEHGGILQERDGNRRKKRPSTDQQNEKTSRKRTKTKTSGKEA